MGCGKTRAGVGQRIYAGHYFEAATGLSYQGSRYYDPSTAKFLSQDPVFLALGDIRVVEQKTKMKQEELLSNPQLLNSYSYVANNPLKHIDENGEFLHIVVGAGVGVIGQYAVDVTRNVTSNGFHANSFTSNLSPASEYVLRAGQGAVIAATAGVAAGPMLGASAVGVGLTAGVTAASTSPLIDAFQQRPIDVKGAVTDGIVTGLTSGVVRSFPGVPGRLPNFGTKAFFAGAHTVRDAIAVGMEVGAASAAVNVTAIFNSFLQRDNVYGDKKADNKK